MSRRAAPLAPPRAPTPVALEGPSEAARAEARLGLYVHVPFCAVRCSYCDFSSGSLSAAKVERYLEAMAREASLRAPLAAAHAFSSVFFGGGTPSALSARHFARLDRLLRDAFTILPNAEVTLEANPETVREPLLEAWANAGVNRLSMGAQSFDPRELARLGRLHDAARPAAAVQLARAYGFERLSLDLMFGFPGHSAGTWSATLDAALALDPGHLSAYCFIPEPGTPLGAKVRSGAARLPSAEQQADLYEMLVSRLAAAGYGAYETSNFCRPGRECRHNLVYWLRRDCLGLGPSAHGLWRGVRYGNRYGLDEWAECLAAGRECADRETETERSRADEILMLGLRLGVGLAADDHAPEAWAAVERRYAAAFERALAEGRIEATSWGVRVASRHRFVADDVIAWLMAEAERGSARSKQRAPDADLTALGVAP